MQQVLVIGESILANISPNQNDIYREKFNVSGFSCTFQVTPDFQAANDVSKENDASFPESVC